MSAPKGKHDAPGLLAATELQFLRALDWLARAPVEARVGLETGDDVVVEGSEGRQVSEQDKSSVKLVGHPFTDRSTALWKTLAIWASQAQAGEHSDATLLLLVTNRPVPECLARRLSDANERSAITSCVEELLQVASDPPEPLALSCSVLRTLGRPALGELVRRIHLCDGSELPIDSQATQVAAQLHFPRTLGDPLVLLDALLGWLHRTCYVLWSQGKQAWIERSQFDHQYHAIVFQIRRDRTSERAARLIPLDPADLAQSRARSFVRQLLLVDADDSDIDNAIASYLRFGTERLRLIEAGDITETDWDDFFGNLFERWQRIARQHQGLMTREDAKEIGRAILRTTADNGFRADLAGKRTSSEYFTAGGYHRLADDSTIWWHPAYQRLRIRNNK